MRKGLFICFEFTINEKLNTSSGIAKKIFNQYQYFESLGYHMEFYNPYMKKLDKVCFRIMRRCPFIGYFIKWDYDINDFKNLDFIYIRKPWFIDYDFLKFLKAVRKINNTLQIITEIPTYPYDNEVMKKSALPLLYKDRFYRKKIKKYIDVVTTYSNDKEIFGIKTINIHNGILFEDEKIDFHPIKKNNEINIISVSNLGFWHGVDRAIDGLRNYYSKDFNYIIKLHIVGDGLEKDKLEKMVKKYNLQKYVIFYGSKNKEEIKELYSMCLIGIDSLGRHRSGVYFNSSLKSKEYLAKGLIIVTSVDSELDYDQLPWIIKFPANETPIDYHTIIFEYEKLIEKEDKISLKNKISDYAKLNFDFSVVMKPIKEYLEE